MILPKFRKINVRSYKPGKSKLSKIKKIVKLSANESALGVSPKVKKEINNKINFSKYPDNKSENLRLAISKNFKCKFEKIICGAGSDEIIQIICQLFLKPRDEVILPQYSFLMYRIYSKINGANVVYAKENNYKISVSEIIKKVSQKTKIVFLANPNNPTGTYLKKNELIQLRKKLRSNILLVVDDAYNEYQQRLFDQLDYEANDLRNRELDYQNNIANLERDMSRELQNRETNLLNYKNQREIEREDIKSRFMFDMQNEEMQRDQNVSMVRQQVDMNLQQEYFNLEREEMNWDLRRQQIQLDYENQLRDYQNQIEQVKFQADVDKERLSMDKAQYEAEMMQLQNEIQSRGTDAERFYEDSLLDFSIEADNRLEELESRRIDENWSDERYQQEIADYDKWYSDRTYEIQSDYDSRIREIEFDQRQYENLQTVVETNEIYQEGERGFFGNPIPGTVRQGGFTDDLSDPGNLAMLGIVITVGTTLLQLARGK